MLLLKKLRNSELSYSLPAQWKEVSQSGRALKAMACEQFECADHLIGSF